MFSRFSLFITFSIIFSLFPCVGSANALSPAVEAGYDTKTCIYDGNSYLLSLDWVSVPVNDSLFSKLNPVNAVSDNWVLSQMPNNLLNILYAKSIYHEDYLLDIPTSESSKNFSFNHASISGSISIPFNEHDTAYLHLDAIGPKFGDISPSMFATGIMTLRLNRPVVLNGYHIKDNQSTFLIVELKSL